MAVDRNAKLGLKNPQHVICIGEYLSFDSKFSTYRE